jgi:hypothetical protein
VSNDLKNVIERADRYLKQGKYRAAWDLLLPYKDQPAARKRLVWLRNKRRAAVQVKESRPSPRRAPVLLGIVLVIIIVIGAFLILGRGDGYDSSDATDSPNNQVAADQTGTALMSASTPATSDSSTALATPATETPVVTEDPQELTLQEQLESWLLDYEGVDNVISLDVDIPEDEPPLAYVELVVFPGNNNTTIPNAFKQHLTESLNTTSYSDFVVIMSDGQQVIEYILNLEDESWQQTPLVSSTPATPRPQ